MRAWPTSLEGFQLRIPPGWYELAPHMAWIEVRRLAELIARGLPGIEHVVELDASVLDELAPKLAIQRCILVLRVAADVPEEPLESLRSRLGPVTLGLVQRERPTPWPDVAWQERFVKGPLLSALKRELRSETHPFAALGIASLPFDEIAKLTPEPIELLEIVEETISHRIEYAEIGTGEEDWLRSALRAASDRLARRLLNLPSELLRRALDVILSAPEGSLSTIDDREASEALTHAGLAWSEGADLLLSPLASFGLSVRGIGRLVQLLPEGAWSEVGMAAIHAAIPSYLPPLRINLLAPDPPYGKWPALVPVEVLDEIRHEVLRVVDGPERELALLEFEVLDGRVREVEAGPVAPEPRARLASLRRVTQSRGWLELLEACNIALDEFDDEQLLNLDFERGQIHRFERMDRLVSVIGSNSAKLAALVRWRAVTPLLGRVTRAKEIEALTEQVEIGLSAITGDSRLEIALTALVGDLWALQQQYRKAAEWWEHVSDAGCEEGTRKRLVLRRLFGLLRLDEVLSALELFQNQKPPLKTNIEDGQDGIVKLQVFQMLLENAPPDANPELQSARLPGSVYRIAAAVDREDWPAASRMARELDATISVRDELAGAWVSASLGNIDAATRVFDDICNRSTETIDTLSYIMAKRGLALAALYRLRIDDLISNLETALEAERRIDINDSLIMEVELAYWRWFTDPDESLFQSKLAAAVQQYRQASISSPQLEKQLGSISLRLWLWAIRHDLPFDTYIIEKSALMLKRFSNQNLTRRLVAAIIERTSKSSDRRSQLLEFARAVARNDAALLQQIEQHASNLPTPSGDHQNQ